MLSQGADPFAVTAPFYDLDLAGYEDDVPMYLELARARGRSVLELGCGTGRVLAPLARAGLEVTGVDSSPAMLELARERVSGLPVALVQADMRDMGEALPGRRFDAVLVPLGGLQLVETAAGVAAVLGTVAQRLDRGGVAVVDVEAPHPDDLAPGPQPLVEHWTRPWQGGAVTKLVAVEGRPSLGLRDVTWHYDVQPAEGPLRRLTHRFTLRTVTAGEIELAARLAGLDAVAWYGDYALSPLEDGAERIVAVLEHAA